MLTIYHSSEKSGRHHLYGVCSDVYQSAELLQSHTCTHIRPQMGVCGIWIDCSVFSGAVYLHPDLRLEDGSHQSGDIDGGAGHPQWIRWLFPLSCGA